MKRIRRDFVMIDATGRKRKYTLFYDKKRLKI